jgi:regulator of replication initiation timing
MLRIKLQIGEFGTFIDLLQNRIEEIKRTNSCTNRMLKVDNDKLRERLYVKYYPADVLIKAEKERDDLQTKLDNLETWLTCLKEKKYRTVDP